MGTSREGLWHPRIVTILGWKDSQETFFWEPERWNKGRKTSWFKVWTTLEGHSKVWPEAGVGDNYS